ncbi:Anti-sigma regulatory factor (Ser/Thr protein kinase) [Streptomyces sp. WMMB 322]|nr:Anti-sigma regulatory factor (Ser/Thr protein kinase) [Streptomyces sp. WMMB 322]
MLASLVWWRRFPSTSSTVTVARRATRTALTGWGLDGDAVSDAALVVSELVTNAVRHGHVRGRLVELRLVYDLEKTVTVEVSDAGDGQPPPTAGRAADVALAESGRGLALVAAFADAWGVQERVVGKTVWARLLVDPRPSHGVNTR